MDQMIKNSIALDDMGIQTIEDLINVVRKNGNEKAAKAILAWVRFYSDERYNEGVRAGRSDIQDKIQSALGLDEIFEGIRDDIYKTNNPI